MVLPYSKGSACLFFLLIYIIIIIIIKIEVRFTYMHTFLLI